MEVSEYEKRRLENIRRNEAEMEALFGSDLQTLRSARQARQEHVAHVQESRKRWTEASNVRTSNKRVSLPRPSSSDVPLRRSSRLRPSKDTNRASAKESKETTTTEDPKEEVLEPVSRTRIDAEALRSQWIAQIESLKTKLNLPSNDGQAWRNKAIEKWGEKVVMALQHDEQRPVDWKQYVLSREPIVPIEGIESPLELLQEKYASDTWKLLISCCLMSRVSSAKVKEACISAFFSKWPTPSQALEAPQEDVKDVIAPLGLFYNRYRSMLELSAKFLSMHEFAIDLQENKVYGFGEFALDSYLIFARGMAANIVPADRNLRAYCAWAKATARQL